MFWILKLLRVYIGGKTETGILLSVIAISLYVLPVLDKFNFDMLVAVMTIIATWTGTAFLGRIENKRGVVDGFKSLFAAFRKKR